MNGVKIKSLIKSNEFINNVAEFLLNQYVELRAAITGSYTKNKEDFYVKKLLKEKFNLDSKYVKYIDIGANDYRRGNNTFLFYKSSVNGGILIEANPLLCEKLEKKRKNDKVFNVAIGTENKNKVDFYILSLPTRSSMDYRAVEEAIALGLKITDVVKVPCVNINDLLEKENFYPDYLSIDIEGMDFEVIKTIDFNKYKIKVIVVEQPNDTKEKEEMDLFMKKNKYVIEGKYKSNVIYILN